MKRKWFVIDRDTNEVVRGPYNSGDTAGAVRTELERAGDIRNLWIISKEVAE